MRVAQPRVIMLHDPLQNNEKVINRDSNMAAGLRRVWHGLDAVPCRFYHAKCLMIAVPFSPQMQSQAEYCADYYKDSGNASGARSASLPTCLRVVDPLASCWVPFVGQSGPSRRGLDLFDELLLLSLQLGGPVLHRVELQSLVQSRLHPSTPVLPRISVTAYPAKHPP